jgi:hypothetical protein
VFNIGSAGRQVLCVLGGESFRSGFNSVYEAFLYALNIDHVHTDSQDHLCDSLFDREPRNVVNGVNTNTEDHPETL